MKAELAGAALPPEDSWPEAPHPSQEFWGAESLADPVSFHNLQRYGQGRAEGMDEGRWAALDAAFMERYLAVIRGDAAWDDAELLELAAALALDHPLHHDRRAAAEGPALDGALVDVTEDHVPDVVMMAADRILGPWADEAPDRALLRAAVQALAFTPILRSGRSPALYRYGHRPRPPEAARLGLKGAMQAPPMLWDARESPWRPLLPIAPQLRPDGPIAGAPALLPGAGRTDFAAARLHPDGEGRWSVCAGIGWEGSAPPADRVMRRLRLELWRLRRVERRATWEDLLRRRGEVLYRMCSLWWWRRVGASPRRRAGPEQPR